MEQFKNLEKRVSVYVFTTFVNVTWRVQCERWIVFDGNCLFIILSYTVVIGP
jgi:hypothetical protein